MTLKATPTTVALIITGITANTDNVLIQQHIKAKG